MTSNVIPPNPPRERRRIVMRRVNTIRFLVVTLCGVALSLAFASQIETDHLGLLRLTVSTSLTGICLLVTLYFALTERPRPVEVVEYIDDDVGIHFGPKE